MALSPDEFIFQMPPHADLPRTEDYCQQVWRLLRNECLGKLKPKSSSVI
jgi:hypothetical protein